MAFSLNAPPTCTSYTKHAIIDELHRHSYLLTGSSQNVKISLNPTGNYFVAEFLMAGPEQRQDSLTHAYIERANFIHTSDDPSDATISKALKVMKNARLRDSKATPAEFDDNQYLFAFAALSDTTLEHLKHITSDFTASIGQEAKAGKKAHVRAQPKLKRAREVPADLHDFLAPNFKTATLTDMAHELMRTAKIIGSRPERIGLSVHHDKGFLLAEIPVSSSGAAHLQAMTKAVLKEGKKVIATTDVDDVEIQSALRVLQKDKYRSSTDLTQHEKAEEVLYILAPISAQAVGDLKNASARTITNLSENYTTKANHNKKMFEGALRELVSHASQNSKNDLQKGKIAFSERILREIFEREAPKKGDAEAYHKAVLTLGGYSSTALRVDPDTFATIKQAQEDLETSLKSPPPTTLKNKARKLKSLMPKMK